MDLPYTTVKALHAGAASLTAGLVILRAYAMVWRPEFLAPRWVRVVPHAVDTVLLLSGVWIAFKLGVASVRDWLPAKLVGVVISIMLSTVALKRELTRGARIAAALAAILVLAYIAGVAMTKSAWVRWLPGYEPVRPRNDPECQ